MINYFQIQRQAAKELIPESIIEKDYFIELLLFYLGNDNLFNRKIVFRGGTALKKIYFPDYRYSEDLDFIIYDGEDLNDFKERINKILKNISSDFPFNPSASSKLHNDRLQIFIQYDIIPEISVTKELKIDILRDNFIPSFKEKRIIFTHQDFKNEICKLNTYILESVVADKISRIMDVDKEARDIYDLWYLLKSDLEISKIRNILIERFGYEIDFHDLISKIKSDSYKKTWKIRLERQIRELPLFDIISGQLEKLIKDKLI